MRTWQIEAGVVAASLAAVALATGSHAVEWIGSGAVLLSFMHGQVSDRLAEREAARASPDVACHRLAARYFVGKEALWLFYFALHQSYAALVGVVLFLLYPVWRRVWRERHPLVRT